MKKFALFLLASCLPIFAQSTIPVPVVGNINTISGVQAGNNNYLEFSLVNCGTNQPSVNGVAVLLNGPVDFYQGPNGTLTLSDGVTPATLYGNDIISCGNLGQTSRYSLVQFVNGQPAGPTKFYFVQSGSGLSFNVNTAQPISLLPPLKYPNPTKCPPGQVQTGLNNDLSVQCSTLTSGPTVAGTVIVTANNNPPFTFVNPPSLQAVIDSSGAGADIYIGAGTYNASGLNLSSSNVHIHGPANGGVATINSTGNPRAAFSITGNQNEVDHITFTGPTQECMIITGTTQSYIHHDTFHDCGAAPGDGTGVFDMTGGTDDRIEYNVITGNGTPQPGGNGGACFNYQINNINTPSWKGGTWGSVPCPQSGGYGLFVQNELRPHVKFNRFEGNNLYIAFAYFDDQDDDSGFNYIDQNNAYQNDNNTDALVGQGYGELCYTDELFDLLVGTMTRASNIVTWTGPSGTTIPYKVGDRIVVQFGFGANGSDFNDGSPFEILSISGSGGANPTMTWAQPGPNDTDSSLVDIGRASSAHFVSDFVTNTAGSGIYSAACSRMMITSPTVSHAGQMYPTGGLGVGGISLNAADNAVVTSPNIDTVISTNQLQIPGQQYAPSCIVNSGSYNLQVVNAQCKNWNQFGFKCNSCSNATVTGGVFDGFGNGIEGIGYPANNNISGLKIKGVTIKNVSLTDIGFPAASAGWGLNNSVENSLLYGNIDGTPTSDCAVIGTSSPVTFIGNTCDGAALGATGTMSFGIVNSAPNSTFLANRIQNLTLATTVPYDDSSGSSYFVGNILLNNVGSPLIPSGTGTFDSYAPINAFNGETIGKTGMLTPLTIAGPANGGGLQIQFGSTSGGLFDTCGTILSTGGLACAYNATQTGSNNWVATSAALPVSVWIYDNTGAHYYFSTAGTCPTTGTNSFATCFGSTPKLNIGTNGALTVNGLAVPLLSGALINGDIISNNASQFIDSGVPIANVSRFCGQVVFSASTASSTASCSWIQAGSHCSFNANAGGPPSGLANMFYTTLGTPGTGTVQLTSSTSGSGTFSVMCSSN